MKRLEGIRATGSQKIATLAPNGDLISLILYFNAATQTWKFDLEWKDFSLIGTRLCSHPNLLLQYENLLPFGMALVTEDGGDPFLINDFSTGRSNLYILTLEEVRGVNLFFTSQKKD